MHSTGTAQVRFVATASIYQNTSFSFKQQYDLLIWKVKLWGLIPL